MNNQHYPFELMPLPYAYDALEPNIDTLTMQLHHDRHLKTYVDNLNAALAGCPEYHCWTLEQLLLHVGRLPCGIRTAVWHNAGGVWNHDFYFKGMTPGGSPPTGALAHKINCTFGDFSSFQAQFKAKALDVFGSGYAWLVLSPGPKNCGLHLCILTTANQDTPIALGVLPLAGIDVWEHAYYLKHYNVRADYIDSWFRVADFGRASQIASQVCAQ